MHYYCRHATRTYLSLPCRPTITIVRKGMGSLAMSRARARIAPRDHRGMVLCSIGILGIVRLGIPYTWASYFLLSTGFMSILLAPFKSPQEQPNDDPSENDCCRSERNNCPISTIHPIDIPLPNNLLFPHLARNNKLNLACSDS